jgi:hypothetical protein
LIERHLEHEYIQQLKDGVVIGEGVDSRSVITRPTLGVGVKKCRSIVPYNDSLRIVVCPSIMTLAVNYFV